VPPVVAAAGRGSGRAKLATASAARRVCGMARNVPGDTGILLDRHVARTYEGTDLLQSVIVGRATTGLSAFV
jgi:glutaryl-CoA dehydrogenase